MYLKNFSLTLLLVMMAMVAYSQNTKLPADFTLSYTFQAGMLPQSESLEIDKDGGKYKYSNKKENQEKSLTREDAGLAKLYSKLTKIGLFEVKNPPAVMKPEAIILDRNREEFRVSANEKTIAVNLNHLDKYSAEDIAKLKKANDAIRNYCKSLRS